MSDELIKRSEVLRVIRKNSVSKSFDRLTQLSLWKQAHDSCVDCIKQVKVVDTVSLEDHEKMKRELATQLLRTQRLLNQPGVFIPNFEMPCNCFECFFRSPFEEIGVGVGLYKKISRCWFAPEDIEDPWRDVTWQMKHREDFCPLVEMKGARKK